MHELAELLKKSGGLSFEDLHTILDALPIPMTWARMPGGEIRFANQSFSKTFGYGSDDFRTVEDWIAYVYPRPEDRARSLKYWRGIWQSGGQGRLVVDPYDVEVRCADGSIKIVENHGILLYDIGISIAIFNDITQRKSAEAQLRRFASEDPLTGIANRRGLEAHWEAVAGRAELGKRGQAAILLIDLDDFKAINDSYGHEAGDDVLVCIASRLKANVRSHDLVCRMGGDEFALLLCNLDGARAVEDICDRLSAALNQPLRAGGRMLSPGASIGVSRYPEDGETLQELLHCADKALYRCKAARIGGWQWYQTPKAA